MFSSICCESWRKYYNKVTRSVLFHSLAKEFILYLAEEFAPPARSMRPELRLPGNPINSQRKIWCDVLWIGSKFWDPLTCMVSTIKNEGKLEAFHWKVYAPVIWYTQNWKLEKSEGWLNECQALIHKTLLATLGSKNQDLETSYVCKTLTARESVVSPFGLPTKVVFNHHSV